MIGAVLFDLDGTLLDIDIEQFMPRYLGALGGFFSEHLKAGLSPVEGRAAFTDATRYMMRPHSETNQQAFSARLHQLTSIDFALPEHAAVLDRFYREVFPGLRESAGPRPGAGQAVQTALDLGMQVAVATNPIFPRVAIEERMRWANIHDLGIATITSYENMHSTKPSSGYFSETAAMIGVEPADCLMVGDDRALDLPGAALGMRTFYVGSGRTAEADWVGGLEDLARLLPRLASA